MLKKKGLLGTIFLILLSLVLFLLTYKDNSLPTIIYYLITPILAYSFGKIDEKD